MLKKIILLVAVTAAIALTLSVVPKAVAASYLSVNAFKASGSDVTSTIQCSGSLQASVKQDICVGIPVKISKSYVKIGDYVKKGERLFDIDKEVTLQALVNSNGDTQAANGSDNSGSSFSTSSEADSALQQALSMGVIGQDTYNSLKGQVQSNAYSSARSSINSSVSNNSQVSETENEKMVDNIESELVAPISGIVTDLADVGSGMTDSTAELAEIMDFNSIQVMAQISEDDIKNVKTGQLAVITGSGLKGTYSGYVKQIYPIAQKDDSSTNSENMINVIIGINNPNNTLSPGLDVNVTVETSVKHGVFVVPFESIQEDDDGTEYVFEFENGHAVRKNIETGDEYDTSVEVLKGIHAGDIVIENPPDNLASGNNIRIKY